MGQGGVAGSEVDRRDTTLGKERHVGPTELRPHFQVSGQGDEQRVVQTRCSSRGMVDHLDGVAILDVGGQHLTDVCLGLVGRPVRGVAVVENQSGRAGDHVVGQTSFHPYRLQRLPVLAAVDDGLAVLVGVQCPE